MYACRSRYASTHTKAATSVCVSLLYSYVVHVGYRSYAPRSRAKSICLHIHANTNNFIYTYAPGYIHTCVFISLMSRFLTKGATGVGSIIVTVYSYRQRELNHNTLSLSLTQRHSVTSYKYNSLLAMMYADSDS